MGVTKEFGADDLLEIADKTGVAIASVKDGYVLVFTRTQLAQILAGVDAKKQDKCVIFVKHRKFDDVASTPHGKL